MDHPFSMYAVRGRGVYKCVRLRTLGRGEYMFVRTQEKTLTRIQTLQDLFYRTNYKQM